MNVTNESRRRAIQLKAQLDKRFFRKGLIVAILSGISYGLFTAFLNLGMASGIWAAWADGLLSAFALTYIVSALGSALMYSFSALWSLALSAVQEHAVAAAAVGHEVMGVIGQRHAGGITVIGQRMASAEKNKFIHECFLPLQWSIEVCCCVEIRGGQ